MTLSGRSSSSSRRSRRGSSSSSSSYFSYGNSEKTYRIFPTAEAARENGGLVCPATLPNPGTKVTIEGVGTATVLESRPSLQSSLYEYSKSGGSISSLQSQLPPGFDTGCTLSVRYAKDGSLDTVSAAQEPPSALDEWINDHPFLASAGLVATTAAMNREASGEYDAMRRRYEEALNAETDDGSLSLEALKKMSGEYWGGSDESDDGDQAIRVTFSFADDGRITGRGRDGVDGSYKIIGGRWQVEGHGRLGSVIQMAWEEKYDEGFTAICTGKYDASSGQIKARFASSRDVSGVFKLAKKPSVF